MNNDEIAAAIAVALNARILDDDDDGPEMLSGFVCFATFQTVNGDRSWSFYTMDSQDMTASIGMASQCDGMLSESWRRHLNDNWDD